MITEKRLNDYKGFQVWKTDDKKEVIYCLIKDDEIINCFKSLSLLKRYVNEVMI